MSQVPVTCRVRPTSGSRADRPYGTDGTLDLQDLPTGPTSPDPRPVTRLQAAEAYERAWSRPDEAAIGAELERCWTARSTHVGPVTDKVTGVAGLTRLILDVPVMFPGARFSVTSSTDFHHDSARFAWRLESSVRIRMAGRDFGFSAEGLDCLDFDPQNRISRVVSFVGPLAPLP
jgi:hypothetical protein